MHAKDCIRNLGPIQDNILSILAKSDYIPKDDLILIGNLKDEAKDWAEKADNHVDAGKALKKKITSLLECL